MSVKWKTLFFKGFFFLTAEIMLTYLGVDDLADYSEYLFDRKVFAQLSQ